MALPMVTFPQVPADTTKPESGELVHGIKESEVAALRTYSMKARETAYCRYSNFRVGATLLSKSGTLVSGANFENASTPNGTCAERVALGAAVTVGGLRQGDFRAVAVASDLVSTHGKDDEYCSPCGMCRQALSEFLPVDVPIFMFDANGRYTVKTMGELLPMSFGARTRFQNS